MKMKIIKDYRTYIALFVSLCIVVAIGIYLTSPKTPPQTREQAWQNFKTYVATLQLPNQIPVYKGESTMGCFQDEAIEDPSLEDCTFSGTYFYAPNGNYRDNGQAIYSFLQEHGFYFEDRESQKEFESKVRDLKVADNLNNSEPIIVDLKNRNVCGCVLVLAISDA